MRLSNHQEMIDWTSQDQFRLEGEIRGVSDAITFAAALISIAIVTATVIICICF